MRFDMHIHSLYSADSQSDVGRIIDTAIKRSLHGISITDHNSFNGSKDALKLNNKDLIIIPGAEYSTDKGHLLVYFLKEGLEYQGLKKDKIGLYSSSDIIGCAHEQNALVFIAHPFNKANILNNDILDYVDGIEAYNSRAAKWKNPLANLNAMEHALKANKPISAGSDAHCLQEIGNAFLEISINKYDLDSIKDAINNHSNTIFGRTSSSVYKSKSQLIKCRKGQGGSPVKPMLKLLYFMWREAGIKIGFEQRPYEGVYLLKDERIERHDFNGYCP